ncbi:MAG: hypothetical protein WCD86_03950 [Ktedonobacteraceae bacterium]
MSGQLMQFVSPIIGPLGDLQNHFSQFASLHRDAHTRLFAQGNNLTQTVGLDLFRGDGSLSFTNSIQQYMLTSEQTLQLLEQAGQAAQTCINDITGAVEAAGEASLDLGIIGYILERTTIEDVLQIGADAIMIIVRDMVEAAVDAGSILGRMILWTFGEVVHLIEQGKNVAELMVHYAWMLMEDIARVLSEWAGNVQGAVRSCASSVASSVAGFWHQSPHDLGTLKKSDQTFLEKPNMQNLAALIEQQEKSSDQVGETWVPGTNTVLITLAGMDLVHPGEITNAGTAIDAGAGDMNNAYLLYIESILNKLPPGTQVIIAGHSLGGIEAQYLAENQGKTDYTIKDVITFGSPEVGPPVNKVEYYQYQNQHDLIPILSWYNISNDGKPDRGEIIVPDSNLNPKIAHIYTNDSALGSVGIPLLPKESCIAWPRGDTTFKAPGAADYTPSPPHTRYF